VIRAFIQPVFEARGAGIELSNFSRLMARLASEPDEWAVAVMSHHMKAWSNDSSGLRGGAGVGNRLR